MNVLAKKRGGVDSSYYFPPIWNILLLYRELCDLTAHIYQNFDNFQSVSYLLNQRAFDSSVFVPEYITLNIIRSLAGKVKVILPSFCYKHCRIF